MLSVRKKKTSIGVVLRSTNMVGETKTGIRAVARRMAFLLEETNANQSAIAKLREEGRRLQVQGGVRSEAVLAKSRELDEVWEREERVSALLGKLYGRNVK